MPGEKRELTLDLLARNKMGTETRAAAHDIENVGQAADKSGKRVGKFGAETELASKGVGKLDKESNKAKRSIQALDHEISAAKKELGELALAFTVADTAAERLDISKGIRKGENDIRRLSKNKNILEDFLPDPKGGKSWGAKLGSSISEGIASVGADLGPLAQVGIVAGAIIAPMVGSAIAGAVVGTVGLGGIIGGFALVARDPAVSDYAKRIGQKFSKDVGASAKDAFGGPVQDSLHALEALAARSAPKIGKIFENTAPGVGKLTDAIVRSGDALIDSFVAASGKSGPALEALGRIIQGTAENVGKFITMLANNADAGASGLDGLNSALQGTISTVSAVVEGLLKVQSTLDGFDKQIDKARYSLEDQVSWLDLTADGYKKGSTAALLYRQGLIGVAGSVNDYNHYLQGTAARTDELSIAHTNAANAARGQRDALVSLSRELKAEVDPVFGLLNAQDNLATTQKNLKTATDKYGSSSREAKNATRELALAAIDLQGKAGALGGTFNGQMTPALRATLAAAGLTNRQMDNLDAQFRAAKRSADAYAKTYQAKVITTYVTNKQNFIGPVQPGSPYSKRASGGPVTRGTPYMVGEHGPEVVVPNGAARVMSAAASRGLARQVGGGVATMAGSQKVQLEVLGQDEVVAMFRYLIRTANLLQV